MCNEINKRYPVHPFAETLPLMNDGEYQSLSDDIKKNGQKVPIVLHEGRIVDGRNREMACFSLGIEPKVVEWDRQGSLIEFIASMNLERRHLDIEQKAFAGAKLTNMKRGYNDRGESPAGDETPGESNSSQEPLVSQTEAAKIFNVSVSSIKRARNILDNAVSEIQEAVENGELTLKEADRIVTAIPRTKQKREIRKGRESLKEMANRYLVAQVKQNQDKSGLTCVVCNGEADTSDKAFMSHLVLLMGRFPAKRRFIQDILNEMSESEFVDEISEATGKILAAIDAGHRKPREIQKRTRLNWDLLNAAIGNMLEYNSIEAHYQEGKSEEARGQKTLLYRRKVTAAVKEEVVETETEIFVKPAQVPNAEIKDRILAAVDDWVCQLPRIRKVVGVPASFDLTELLDEMMDDDLLVQKESGPITCFFRPSRVPSKFWSTGSDRIGFEMDINIPPGALDLTQENNIAF